ncbi:signal peptidase I [Heliobacterium chlorum]|uniref:Signal peptidase I n=1 Tax=Heliobacterium chlorum TaxID=2698 RepID=A0ABR7T5A3_HELCL|nr:signal peptidase I [Heliobacterium chlorum]MBC9785550.1 signal peptidase I [Heliobacterium chlorum]
MQTKIKKIIVEYVGPVMFALILSLFIRTYIAEAYWIPSESMVPTLNVNDHLIVEKVTEKIVGFERGDIIVFKAPPQLAKDENLIKRVIGLPGDTVEIHNGKLYINNEVLDEPYVKVKMLQDFKPFTVPENSLFVLGDNRNNSYDSRYWGVVPQETVIGKAVARYYPFNEMGLLGHR